ncbi:MAG: ATP-binding protein [Bacteroidales bacterium]|nr:ATP-binding protein [Bacteroidales bacterium]MDY0215430.1 ATP-binding protein [Bacteroidales bacterium]
MEIAVISGKGGTGKSFISAALATLKEKVLLADCDVDAANLYLIFEPTHEDEAIYIAGESAVIDHKKCSRCGLCISYCRFDALSFDKEHKVDVNETNCDGCRLCAKICPEKAIVMIQNDKSRMYSGTFRNGKMVYGRLAPGEENSGKLVNMVRDKAKKVAKENNLDTIIIDGPPGIGCAVISSITGVDHAVIVTEPTISGMHDLKRTFEVTDKFNLKTWVIINKYDLNEKISKEVEQYCRGKNIQVLANIAFDPGVVQAMVNKKSITEYAPNSVISQQIENAFQKINTHGK